MNACVIRYRYKHNQIQMSLKRHTIGVLTSCHARLAYANYTHKNPLSHVNIYNQYHINENTHDIQKSRFMIIFIILKICMVVKVKQAKYYLAYIQMTGPALMTSTTTSTLLKKNQRFSMDKAQPNSYCRQLIDTWRYNLAWRYFIVCIQRVEFLVQMNIRDCLPMQ